MISHKSKELRIPVSELCLALDIPKASYYRIINPVVKQKEKERVSHRKLAEKEEDYILSILNSERFCDQSPASIYYTLLDEGRYLCSISTMYRILRKNNQNIQRRQKSKGFYEKPELLAEKPNELWSWDITKLKGPAKWTYFYLYVILDVFSRKVVGWMVAERESSHLAEILIDGTCKRENIEKDQLTIHSDRGAAMKSKAVALLLSDPGVTKTHSRPYVSNDNPYSESAFKTIKYRPEFPGQFGCLEDARFFCGVFFNWYNFEHKHSGIAMLSPSDLHSGNQDRIISNRQITAHKAYIQHPERFVKGVSIIKKPEMKVWINKPKIAESDVEEDLNIAV